MQAQFLAAVQEGNAKEVRTLIQNNSLNFNISYYIRGNTRKIKKLVKWNILKVPANLNPTDPEIRRIIISHKEENLTKEQLNTLILFLKNHATTSAKELVYITWTYLDNIKLDQTTIDKALLIAAQNGDAQILEMLLSGGFTKAEPVVLKGSPDKLNSNKNFIAYFKCPTYRFNYSIADPNAQNAQGENALQLAVQSRSKMCVAYLIRYGATIPKNDLATMLFCKKSLSDLLKFCRSDEKLKLKMRFEATFPELFPPPRWYTLMLYVQRLASNLMAHRFVAPIFKRLAQAFGYPRNTITNLTATAPPPPQLADEPTRAIVASPESTSTTNSYKKKTPSKRSASF